MQFTSLSFWAILCVITLFYPLFCRRILLRNLFLLIVSLALYAAWDLRFLGLLLLQTVVVFAAAQLLPHIRYRRTLLWITILFLLGILGLCKYANFFTANLTALAGTAGLYLDLPTVHLLLPLGLSFYCFQLIGYMADIYRKKYEPTTDLIAFALFVSFFPKIASGPIERGDGFLVQLKEMRPVTLQRVKEGIFLILWGCVLKLCVADNVARITSIATASAQAFSAHTIAGLLAITLQIYADFAGYSFIAVGIAALFGFDLIWNFRHPYVASSASDFWRRWHISLSEWCRDYIYFSLGGSRKGLAITVCNLFIIMLAVGFWHGARWTFILWGFYEGILLASHHVMRHLKKTRGWSLPWKEGSLIPTILFFLCTMFGWLIFQSRSVSELVSFAGAMRLHADLLIGVVAVLWVPVVVMETIQIRSGDDLWITKQRLPLQLLCLYLALYAIMLLPPVSLSSFIYTQF